MEHAKLSTSHCLPSLNREKIASALNVLVADAFALYVKTKNYHWHLNGPHFRDYHLMFDEQASQIFETIDVIAERARKLGMSTITSIKNISSLKTIKCDDELPLSEQVMLERLLHDNLLFIENIRKAHQVCDEAGDMASTSVLEVYLDEAERRAWFLQASLKK